MTRLRVTTTYDFSEKEYANYIARLKRHPDLEKAATDLELFGYGIFKDPVGVGETTYQRLVGSTDDQ